MNQHRVALRLPALARRRVAGLEISAGHLRVADGFGPTAPSAECAVASSALDEGRVADVGELASAISELWSTSGVRTRDVVIGISSHDVVARQVEMPMLTDSDLAAALRFELADMIPFPVADSVIRFRRMDDLTEDRATPQVRLLAVAALTDTLRSYVEVAERAGLRVRNIDLSTFALARAATLEGASDATEAVVSVAHDGISVVIHRAGTVRFTRTIATQLGDGVDGELASELALIEQYRLRSDGSATGSTITQTDPVVEAIRGTLEYASIQPGATAVDRIAVCGDDLADKAAARLAAELGIPIRHVAPDGMDGRYAIAAGLTLPGDDGQRGPRPLGLLPDRRKADGASALARRGAVAAIGAATLLAGVSVGAGPDLGAANNAQQRASNQVAALQRELAPLAADARAARDVASRDARITRIEAMSTDWASLTAAVRQVAPPGATVVSITGEGPKTAKSGRHTRGSLRLVGTAPSQAAVSDWMDAIDRIDGLRTPWLSSVSGSRGRDGRTETAFALTVEIDKATK